MSYLQTLNEKQREAVQTTEGYLRVIAGAGSGKTKLLVSRYAYLVREYGIDPANVLCVTFTNKAAGEMKRRIRALIGAAYDTSLICTYHGFCARLLREDHEKIFYPKEFRILDKAQQKEILGEIYQKYELKLDHGAFEKLLKQIAFYKSNNRDYVSKMCCTEACGILPSVRTQDEQILEDFMQYQKRIYAMDFNDLLLFALDVLGRHASVREKWQDRLNYIQVDEFQDSSKNEMELIDILSAKHRNLMIVGDPDQNIYEWRGSDVKLLVDFDAEHVPTETIFLNQNYRSTPQILRCANTLIEHNVFRLKKELFTNDPAGEAVYHYHTKNEYAEADAIAQTILDLHRNEGCSLSSFAVLYRSGFLSRVVEKKFTECGIPYEIFGGVKFYHRMEVQDVMAYLRLLAFDDDLAFKRIVNKPRRRFGRIKLQQLLALQEGASLFETLKAHLDHPAFKASGAVGFVQMIDRLREDAKTLSLSDLTEEVCSQSGYETYIRELGDAERLDNLSEFKRLCAEFENNLGEEITLEEFINHIALQSEDDSDDSPDKVKLMTIHAAKGLEFPHVFVLGFSEGIFPSAKTIEERKQAGLEEERRLCYVAITRAEKRLYLLDSEGYTQNGKEKLPSRFLKEIGEDHYIRIGTISKDLQEAADRLASELTGETPSSLKAIGDTVCHPAFGEGVIVGYEKNRSSYRIVFPSLNSERVLSAAFFNRTRTLPAPKPDPKPTVPSLMDTEDDIEVDILLDTMLETPPPDISPFTDDEPFCGISNRFEQVDTLLEPLLRDDALSTVSPASMSAPDVSPFTVFEPFEEMPCEAKETDILFEQLTQAESHTTVYRPEEVPQSEWSCDGVTDLGAPVGVCQLCGRAIVRYVHHMVHPVHPSLHVGCVCAGRLEDDFDGAKRREQEFKSKQLRKERFKARQWKVSKNNNRYLKIKDHLIVLYYHEKSRRWKYALDNRFSDVFFATKEAAMDAAFDALEALLNG